MKKKNKFIFGGIIGILLGCMLTSTYFYGFLKKIIKGLNDNLKDYNY